MKFYDPQFNDAGVQAFRRIQGEFRPSSFGRAMQKCGALALVGLGVFIVNRLYLDYHSHEALGAMWILVVEAIGMVGLGGYMWRRAGSWLRFSLGQLQYLSASGQVLWEEDLAGITAVEKRSTRNGEYLVVRWGDKRHWISFTEELRAALELRMGAGRTAPQVEPAEDVVATAFPPWRCSKCGEENPGEFEVCWKCEKEKGASSGEEVKT